MLRAITSGIAVVVGAVVLLGFQPVAAKSTRFATVTSWADGDTVNTSRGIVRLIGIDAPETGTCGADNAKSLAEQLAPVGSRVKLIHPAGENKKDRYGRLLRYVIASHVDVGLAQINQGAVARYDGLDGYPRHPRQAGY